MKVVNKVDAVVVGSGATGSHMAARLAEAGMEVLVLEAGPERSLSSLISSPIWARRLKWSGSPVEESGDHPVGQVFNSGYGVGGSAMHHFAVWPRLHENDFSIRSDHDIGLDWPINYDDLRPWYDAVQSECGISGDAAGEIWRPDGDDYPMPPVPVFAQGSAIAEGFHKLGMQTSALPLAVTSREYDGRQPCIWDGWCDAGCPIGALANPLTVHLPKAVAAGATLQANSTAVRILADKGRATGVEVVDSEDPSRVRKIYADIVVLAAFTVQNARLLLASADDNHPAGLGNDNDQVGRYLTAHFAAPVFGLFEQETAPHLGATGGQLLNQQHYDDKAKFAGVGAFGSYQWMIAQAMKPTDLLGIAPSRADLIGSELESFMKHAVRHFGMMTGVVEDLPLAENRVSLSQTRDRYGMPLAHASHTSDSRSLALFHAAIAEGKSVLEAAGATEVWSGGPATMHIMGGTIMGDDPTESVTNSFGQVHGLPNLVISGPSLFPTNGGVNPTFTAHALAARSAERVIRTAG